MEPGRATILLLFWVLLFLSRCRADIPFFYALNLPGAEMGILAWNIPFKNASIQGPMELRTLSFLYCLLVGSWKSKTRAA